MPAVAAVVEGIFLPSGFLEVAAEQDRTLRRLEIRELEQAAEVADMEILRTLLRQIYPEAPRLTVELEGQQVHREPRAAPALVSSSSHGKEE